MTKTEKSRDRSGSDGICQTENSCFDFRAAMFRQSLSKEIAQYLQIISLIQLYCWFSAV